MAKVLCGITQNKTFWADEILEILIKLCELKFAARSNYCACVVPLTSLHYLWLHKRYSRYGNQSISAEYLLISVFSLAEYSFYWWGSSFLVNSDCSRSKFVSHHSAYMVVHLLKAGNPWHSDNVISFDGKRTIVCHFYLNTETTIFCNCKLMQKMMHVYSIT